MKRSNRFPRDPTLWHVYQALNSAQAALGYLLLARDELTNACAPKTLARVQSAISSAKGAVRNAGYRVTRATMKATNG